MAGLTEFYCRLNETSHASNGWTIPLSTPQYTRAIQCRSGEIFSLGKDIYRAKRTILPDCPLLGQSASGLKIMTIAN
jgi:hypothetical protein